MEIVHVTAHKVFLGGGERLVDCWINGSKHESVFYAMSGGIDYGNPKFKTYQNSAELAKILASKHADAVVVIHDPFLSSESWLMQVKRRVWFIHGAFAFTFNIASIPPPLFALSNYKPKTIAKAWQGVFIAPIHLGIDTDKYKPSGAKREGRFVCGIVGRVSEEKCPLYFFDFIDRFNAANPDHNYDFHYYGRGIPESDFYKSFIARSAQTRHFYYKGFVDKADAPSLYGRFDCLLVPSLSESGSFAILEAQASGLRVFALNRDGIPFHVVNGSPLFENYDQMFVALKYYNRKKAEALAPQIRREIVANYNLKDWVYKLDVLAEIASFI